MKPFTPEQLADLKAHYERIAAVNPDGHTFQQLRSFVANLPDDLKTQLAQADIRWLSYLARRSLSKPN